MERLRGVVIRQKIGSVGGFVEHGWETHWRSLQPQIKTMAPTMPPPLAYEFA